MLQCGGSDIVGVYTLEMATRAKTQLILILAEPEREFEKKRQSITITIRKTSKLLQTKGWSKSPSVPVQMQRFNNLCATRQLLIKAEMLIQNKASSWFTNIYHVFTWSQTKGWLNSWSVHCNGKWEKVQMKLILCFIVWLCSITNFLRAEKRYLRKVDRLFVRDVSVSCHFISFCYGLVIPDPPDPPGPPQTHPTWPRCY